MNELNTELMTALLKNESLDDVFRSHLETAVNDILKIELTEFLERHSKRYPKLSGIFKRAEHSLYSFLKFPEAIRSSLYTTNLIERSNKGLKHRSKIKEQFPNEDALERFVCCYYSDQNRSYAERLQRGFSLASSEIMQMFELPPSGNTDGSTTIAA